MIHVHPLIVAGMVVLILAQPSSISSILVCAQPPTPQELIPNQLGANGLFGTSVAADGNRIVVGADRFNSGLGSASFFQVIDGDINTQQLVPGFGLTPGSEFGSAVAVSGDRAIVGARGAGGGEAFIYDLTFCCSPTVFLPRSGQPFAGDFGISVDLDGETAIIGAPGDNFSRGAAYIYPDVNESATSVRVTAGTDERIKDDFGVSVAVSAGRAVVGAPGPARGTKLGGDAGVPGRAYVVNASNGIRLFRLTADETNPADENGNSFGFSVAIDGQLVVVGAPTASNSDIGRRSGAAYVFDLDDCSASACSSTKLTASDGNSFDLFGAAVGIFDNTVMVGAPLGRHANDADALGGAAYMFNARTGEQLAKLTAGPGQQFGDGFGASVAIGDQTAVVGAIQYDSQGMEDTGGAFLFDTTLQPGDADQDFDFDAFDLIRVQIAGKFLSGQPATWGEGDWNGAPGGFPGNPPPGNGLFDTMDLVAAMIEDDFAFGGNRARQAVDDYPLGSASVIYDANSGEIRVDAPAGTELTLLSIDSKSGIFAGSPAKGLGGAFDVHADESIFKATFGGSFGSLSFGNVARRGLEQDFLVADLSIVGVVSGINEIDVVNLVYVPEPHAYVLAAFSLIGLIATCRRRHGKCGVSVGFVMRCSP